MIEHIMISALYNFLVKPLRILSTWKTQQLKMRLTEQIVLESLISKESRTFEKS